MKTLFLLLFLSPLAQAEVLSLSVGESLRLRAPTDAQVRIGQRGIIRVVDAGETLHLIGLKEGVTTMTVGSRPYQVTVSRGHQKKFHEDLRNALESMKGLKLRADVQPPEVGGTLLRFSDWEELSQIASRTQGTYRFVARALPDVAEKAIIRFQDLLEKQGLPFLRFSTEPQLTLHVAGHQKQLEISAREIMAPFGVDVVADDSQLQLEPLVKTQVVLAELNRSQNQTFGIDWPNQYQATILPKPDISKDLQVTLKAMAAQGQAQILASPNLLCRSGGEARFHAGGEFPIRIISRQTRDVIWKSHGVLLKIKPKADFQGAISVEIETEISLLDSANSVDGIPALKKNSVHSHLDLAGKRTIALSGLLRESWGHSQQGLPLLSQIPVLGALFSSRQYQRDQSELVIFVTPEVFTPAPDQKVELPKGWVTHEW
ncbi:MAG: hypothetical protein AB7F86_04145 [Bdellovibrionales bacterium]